MWSGKDFREGNTALWRSLDEFVSSCRLLGTPCSHTTIKEAVQGEERPLGPGLLRKGFVGEVGSSSRPQVLSRTGKVKEKEEIPGWANV